MKRVLLCSLALLFTGCLTAPKIEKKVIYEPKKVLLKRAAQLNKTPNELALIYKEELSNKFNSLPKQVSPLLVLEEIKSEKNQVVLTFEFLQRIDNIYKNRLYYEYYSTFLNKSCNKKSTRLLLEKGMIIEKRYFYNKEELFRLRAFEELCQKVGL